MTKSSAGYRPAFHSRTPHRMAQRIVHRMAGRMARSGSALITALVLSVCLLGSGSPQVASAAFVTAPEFTAPIQAASLTETWTVSGWQGSLPQHITSATVTFPAGFTVPANPTVTVRGNDVACAVVRAVTTGQSIAIAISGPCESSAASGRQTITVAGVTNPTAPGAIAAAGFTLATSGDSEVSARSNVVIWGVTTSAAVCRLAGSQSYAEVIFATDAAAVARNTGSGTAAALLVTTSVGTLRWTPTFTGTLGVMNAMVEGATSAQATVAAGVSPGSSMVVAVALSGSSPTLVTLRVSPTTGGTPVLFGSTQVSFVDNVCVTPASTPATPPPAAAGGAFSGGTIAASGVSIVSFTGTTTQLDAAGAAAKAVSVSATVSGTMLTFVVGAPAFVNADFNAVFPTGLSSTLVIVKT